MTDHATDGVVEVDATGRVSFACPVVLRLLGAGSARDVVGLDVSDALARGGQGAAALGVGRVLRAWRSMPSEHSFTVHDDTGAPESEWHVAPQGTGGVVVVRPASAQHDPRTGAPEGASAARGDTDALVDLARDLAGSADHLEDALEQLARGACALLGGDGACAVLLDDGAATIVAGCGTLETLRGQQTELHEPPSPIHDAIERKRIVVSTLPDTDGGPRRHVLVAPLVTGDVARAALCVVTGSARGFSPRDRALAERLAEHGALAMRNHRLYHSVQRSARDARLLADAAQVLARHMTPETLYPALAAVVREGLGACGFTAALADPETGRVERLYTEGASIAALSEPVDLWQTAAGRVARDRQPIFVDGTLPEGATEADRTVAKRLRAAGVCARAMLPLEADETRGVLSLQFPERRAFDEPERRLLSDFAALVAIAVRNATLFVARERERDRAAAAAEIARLALDAETLELGAAAILGVLDRLVPTDGKALSVLRDGARSLECAAATGTIAFLRGLRSARATGATAVTPRADGVVAPVLVSDLRHVLTVERCPEAAHEPAIAASAVIVPLVARGRAIGDLAVTIPLGDSLDAHRRDTLARLGAPVALALDALLLAEERRRRLAEERRMAEQLRQAEKMAALGELVAGVAHEINNPLTGISAFAELLLDDGLGEEQRESVRLIKREADRAVGVVRDLLVFSRKTEPSYEALDLNELVERTLRLRAYALRALGIEVETSFVDGLPLVLGDQAKLQQVVLNLLLNAEHAMRDSATRVLHVDTRRANGRAVLRIHDTGTGIPADVLPRIFEPFFTTKPAGEGTGLGLSVSYGIVQAHGGELRCESTPGAGTTLEVSLPTPTPA